MKNGGMTPADSLSDELNAGKALLQLLKQEQEHLVHPDADALARIAEDKASVVTQMTELAQQRHRLLGTAGFEASEPGMQAWLDDRANSAAATAWNALIDIARQAKELNRTNGLLIGQQMARNQAALNVLQGKQQDNAMYGPNGQSTAQASSRRLVIG